MDNEASATTTHTGPDDPQGQHECQQGLLSSTAMICTKAQDARASQTGIVARRAERDRILKNGVALSHVCTNCYVLGKPCKFDLEAHANKRAGDDCAWCFSEGYACTGKILVAAFQAGDPEISVVDQVRKPEKQLCGLPPGWNCSLSSQSGRRPFFLCTLKNGDTETTWTLPEGTNLTQWESMCRAIGVPEVWRPQKHELQQFALTEIRQATAMAVQEIEKPKEDTKLAPYASEGPVQHAGRTSNAANAVINPKNGTMRTELTPKDTGSTQAKQAVAPTSQVAKTVPSKDKIEAQTMKEVSKLPAFKKRVSADTVPQLAIEIKDSDTPPIEDDDLDFFKFGRTRMGGVPSNDTRCRFCSTFLGGNIKAVDNHERYNCRHNPDQFFNRVIREKICTHFPRHFHGRVLYAHLAQDGSLIDAPTAGTHATSSNNGARPSLTPRTSKMDDDRRRGYSPEFNRMRRPSPSRSPRPQANEHGYGRTRSPISFQPRAVPSRPGYSDFRRRSPSPGRYIDRERGGDWRQERSPGSSNIHARPTSRSRRYREDPISPEMRPYRRPPSSGRHDHRSPSPEPRRRVPSERSPSPFSRRQAISRPPAEHGYQRPRSRSPPVSFARRDGASQREAGRSAEKSRGRSRSRSPIRIPNAPVANAVVHRTRSPLYAPEKRVVATSSFAAGAEKATDPRLARPPPVVQPSPPMKVKEEAVVRQVAVAERERELMTPVSLDSTPAATGQAVPAPARPLERGLSLRTLARMLQSEQPSTAVDLYINRRLSAVDKTSERASAPGDVVSALRCLPDLLDFLSLQKQEGFSGGSDEEARYVLETYVRSMAGGEEPLHFLLVLEDETDIELVDRYFEVMNIA
ncbi:hypothetical protein BCR37DRAFT_414425 [Protomyces lactucae-debilis]|uniref:Uncharacterized protein n=1 Tax=Protomyces lactucae-debilis TaxID=2754530 RepID=A0A1Y2FAD1_PROLT|nr:uncharacterized protein BCR37DRAFT_414425 [Protomyces lactucae-debilis]ORY79825.1 hypothetical protein BCR37DRAFT_414425 [Protomyces lactucae-debilis]